MIAGSGGNGVTIGGGVSVGGDTTAWVSETEVEPVESVLPS